MQNGLFLNYGSINAIAMNYALIEDSIEEKCVLAEELGHYFCDATYSIYDNITTINKAEYRAKKWQSMTLVPLKRLKDLISDGLSKNEICEELEITENVLDNAFQIYKNKGVI